MIDNNEFLTPKIKLAQIINQKSLHAKNQMFKCKYCIINDMAPEQVNKCFKKCNLNTNNSKFCIINIAERLKEPDFAIYLKNVKIKKGENKT